MNLYKEQKKESNRANTLIAYGCKKSCICGNRNIVFYDPNQDKKLCPWCGRYVYRNKKSEFKDKLMRTINEK